MHLLEADQQRSVDKIGIPEDKVDRLIVMNDGNFKGMQDREHSFAEIADYIEKNL
jgi:hypothetical protein